mmetsp:Transcript_54273/g.118946  ORF Transcript_54273/g.118946 Transcript_54273/m.118946 type:complete len:541 (+) Transcript_54273:20-1642(+)
MVSVRQRRRASSQPLPKPKVHEDVATKFGFRTSLSMLGLAACTVLTVPVPVMALYRGDVVPPNVMLSDVMACHPVYEAVYTWFWGMTMCAGCFVFREASLYWAREAPELRPDIGRLLSVMYVIITPCLIGLVSFQYRHESKGLASEVYLDSDFLQYSMHTVFTSIFFVAVSGLSFIISQRIMPVLEKKGLVHPVDRLWGAAAGQLLVGLLVPAAILRLLHLFYDDVFWSIPLVVAELIFIQGSVIACFCGTKKLMMALDAEDPIIELDHWWAKLQDVYVDVYVPETALGCILSRPRRIGFRCWLSGAALCATTFLTLLLPMVGLYRGDVVVPDVMLSDLMACHPVYEAFYTWLWGFTMLSVCFVLREATLHWRKEMPLIVPATGRLLTIMYTVLTPCLIGLVAFQSRRFDFDVGFLDTNFFQYLMHVVFTSIFFLAVVAIAFIMTWQLLPKLGEQGLVHPADGFWAASVGKALVMLLAPTAVVRCLHLFHDQMQWAVPMLVAELAFIQGGVIVCFVGTARLMMELDAADPIMKIGHFILR